MSCVLPQKQFCDLIPGDYVWIIGHRALVIKYDKKRSFITVLIDNKIDKIYYNPENWVYVISGEFE